MNSAPQILQTERRDMAFIPLQVSHAEIRQVMGPGIQEVMAAAQAQGIGPTGPWFTHHWRITPEGFDFQICVPVSAPIQPVGRVLPGEWPAMKVVKAVYQGGYEGLPVAWGEFDAWIRAQRLKVGEDLWEQYTSGPESSDNPSDWRTELNRQILD